MKGDLTCIEGRLFRHDPQWDDPDLETDVGQCPDCSGDGCADELCDNNGGEYIAPLPWDALHCGWVLTDALQVAVVRAQETGRDTLVCEFRSNSITWPNVRYGRQSDGVWRRIGKPVKPTAMYRVQPDGGWWRLGKDSDDCEFVDAFKPEETLADPYHLFVGNPFC